MQTTVNLGSGLIAGFAAALISQPADTMLSKINKTKGLPGEGITSRLIKIARDLGLKGLYTGTGARLFMVCLYFPPLPNLNSPAARTRLLTRAGRHSDSRWDKALYFSSPKEAKEARQFRELASSRLLNLYE
jgi:hypothetical protein